MSSRTPTLLAECTWTDVESALEDGTRTAVVAVGAIEQHGPHLPLNMDTIDGEELTRRIAEELGDALAAPPIRPGCSGHHLEFPGTITVPPETLMDVIRSYCRSLSGHGFEFVALVPTHGGNFGPVNAVAPDVGREVEATVLALADLERYMELQNEGLRAAGVDYEEDPIHAGAVETATVQAIDDELVRDERIEPGYEGAVSTTRLLSEGFASITENGVLGDPRKATPEAGEAVLDSVVEAYVERIEREREAV
jgi:creatinine amidohydrolase